MGYEAENYLFGFVDTMDIAEFDGAIFRWLVFRRARPVLGKAGVLQEDRKDDHEHCIYGEWSV